MSNRNLTRESGSSYLVRFFEDDTKLVVNRSRIFSDGRLKVGDKCTIQWGRNSEESSDGEILDCGEYTHMQRKLKDSLLQCEKSGDKNGARRRPQTKKPVTEKGPEKQPPRKKLKTGEKPAARVLFRSTGAVTSTASDSSATASVSTASDISATALMSTASDTSDTASVSTASDASATPLMSTASDTSATASVSTASDTSAVVSSTSTSTAKDTSATESVRLSVISSSTASLSSTAESSSPLQPRMPINQTDVHLAATSSTSVPIAVTHNSSANESQNNRTTLHQPLIQEQTQQTPQQAKRKRPNPIDLTDNLPVPSSSSISPLCRTGFAAFDSPSRTPSSSILRSPAPAERTEKPILTMLSAINLSIERVNKRQTEFEQVITRKIDTANKRMANIELTLNTVLERLDEAKATNYRSSADPEQTVSEEIFADIPECYRICLDELRELQISSSCAGNFALGLTRKLYPELFGPGNLIFKFSYNGGGVLGKEELDVDRKAVIVKYVHAFYPSTKKTSVWKDSVIPKINEGLRRKEGTSDEEKQKKKEKKKNNTKTGASVNDTSEQPAAVLSASSSNQHHTTVLGTAGNSFSQNDGETCNDCFQDIPDIAQPFSESISFSELILNDISYDLTAGFSD